MSWARMRSTELEELRAFLLPQEWHCVPLTSYLARGETGLTFAFRSGGALRQALMIARGHVVLPALDPADPSAPPDLARELPRGFTVMGMEHSVRHVEGALGRSPARAVDYHLMLLPRAEYRPCPVEIAPELGPISVRAATFADRRSLYPLQREYETEEVLLEPAAHDPRLCKAALARALNEQVIFLAHSRRGPVAKAGTNARGFRVDQIGGVYTIPGLRNRGLGRLVMQALLDELFRSRDAACLFVKKPNLPAISLYCRLGFSIAGAYRISYYYP